MYNVIWYKFRSHNRYVGYIQLLTQEINHYKLSGIENQDKLDAGKKSYLDTPPDELIEDEFKKKRIFAWEFVMSRYNGARFENQQENIISATNKAKFRFHIPDGYKYSQIDNYSTLDKDFFEKIIYPIYGVRKTGFKQIAINALKFPFDVFYQIVKLYSPRKRNLVSISPNKNIDSRYVKGGWNYPIVITQTSFVPVLLIFLYLIYFIFFKDRSDTNIFESDSGWKVITIFIGSSFIFGIWISKFLKGIYEISHGNESIEFFCWTFFIYRVQLLNSYDIMPSYFSRAFIRYFKSQLILSKLKEERIDEFAKALAKKSGVSLSDYKGKLQLCKKLDNSHTKFHRELNKKIKESLQKPIT